MWLPKVELTQMERGGRESAFSSIPAVCPLTGKLCAAAQSSSWEVFTWRQAGRLGQEFVVRSHPLSGRLK